MIARPKGPTRKIKRTVQEKTDPQSQKTLKYQFYRDILHPTILKLKNEMGKYQESIITKNIFSEIKFVICFS